MLAIKNSLVKFFKMESAGGLVLMATALLAIIIANSPLYEYYKMLIDIPIEFKIGALEVAKPILLWVNDGLMAIFFFLIGLELKREVMEGELSSVQNIIFPGIGAIGGMAIPAAIYVIFNYNDPVAMKGWAIPAATDIAFALGILSLLGSRVPVSIKVFLTSLAIFDDIGAILIIALFYTAKISLIALAVAAICIVVLIILNRLHVEARSVYLTIGIIMWFALLKSGVHATLAGVVMAMFIPITSKNDPDFSPLKTLEHDLHSAVAFLILPVFAFMNSGINLKGVGLEQISHGVSLGIILGLFIGKQLGIMVFCWIGVKLKLTNLPPGIRWSTLYGTAILCGIGFTMSLFIGSLSFEETGVNLLFDERLGIIIGSLFSGILGYFVLKFTLDKKVNTEALQ